MSRKPASDGKNTPGGNVKVTRADWLELAMQVLIRDGVEAVRIKPLGEALGVSRSSFYWYFTSRQNLLETLLEEWQSSNTTALVKMAGLPASTITEAVGNVFRCVINPQLFDTRLDFAIRAWARHSDEVRTVLRASDERRLSALQAMFERFDYPELEAIARARILYFMQIGYDDAQLNESIAFRSMLMPAYIVGFTGKEPTAQEVADLQAYADQLNS